MINNIEFKFIYKFSNNNSLNKSIFIPITSKVITSSELDEAIYIYLYYKYNYPITRIGVLIESINSKEYIIKNEYFTMAVRDIKLDISKINWSCADESAVSISFSDQLYFSLDNKGNKTAGLKLYLVIDIKNYDIEENKAFFKDFNIEDYDKLTYLNDYGRLRKDENKQIFISTLHFAKQKRVKERAQIFQRYMEKMQEERMRSIRFTYEIIEYYFKDILTDEQIIQKFLSENNDISELDKQEFIKWLNLNEEDKFSYSFYMNDEKIFIITKNNKEIFNIDEKIAQITNTNGHIEEESDE